MIGFPSRRPAAVAVQYSIRTSFEEPFYPDYLFKNDSSGDELINPKSNSEVIDLTSERYANNGEVSALLEPRAIREPDVN